MRAWLLCPMVGSGSVLDPYRAKYGRRLVPGIVRGTTQTVHPDVCLRQIEAAPAVVAQVLGQSDVAPITVEQTLGDALGATAANRLATFLGAHELPQHFIAPVMTTDQALRRLTGVFAISQRARGLYREGVRGRLVRAGVTLATPWSSCPAPLRAELLAIRDSFRWTQGEVDPSAAMELREVLDLFGDGFERIGQRKQTRISNSLPVSDTFSSGTTLETHTTDSTHSWGGEANNYSISGGVVSTESQGNFLASVDPSDSETDVLAEITGDLGGGTNTNYRLGVGCRTDAGAWATFDGYLTRLISLGASSVVHDAFEATDGGNSGLTEIIDGSTGLDESTVYKIGVEAIGSTIDAYLDDVSETSGVGVTDATHDGTNTLVTMYQRATGSSATAFGAESAATGGVTGALAEAVDLSETWGAVATTQGGLAESAAFSDTVAAAAAAIGTLAESTGVSDSAGAVSAAIAGLAEGIGLDDTDTALGIALATLAESTDLADQLVAAAAGLAMLVEDVTLAETWSAATQGTQTGALAESTDLADQLTALAAAVADLQEGLALSDTVTAAAASLGALVFGVGLTSTWSATTSTDSVVIGAAATLSNLRGNSATLVQTLARGATLK